MTNTLAYHTKELFMIKSFIVQSLGSPPFSVYLQRSYFNFFSSLQTRRYKMFLQFSQAGKEIIRDTIFLLDRCYEVLCV